ncbi:MAG: hypothetical protein ABIK64_04645 [Bacillota bacterium]
MMERLKIKLQALMAGRNGVDRLSQAMLWTGVFLLVLAMLLTSPVLNIVSLAIYMLAILRIFSRNTVKRSAENRYFMNKTTQIQKAAAHRRNRFKNRKQYRYFKCPNCRSWLRVPRGKGQVKITCGKCGHQFSYISR